MISKTAKMLLQRKSLASVAPLGEKYLFFFHSTVQPNLQDIYIQCFFHNNQQDNYIQCPFVDSVRNGCR